MLQFPGVYPVEGKTNKWLIKVKVSVDGEKYQTTKIVECKSAKQAYNIKVKLTEEARERLKLGQGKVDDKMIFSDLVEYWKSTEYKSLAPTTRQRYDNILKNQIMPYFGDKRVRKINEVMIYKFIDYAKYEYGGNISQTTLNHWLMLLRTILTFAKKRRIITGNPFEFVEMAKNDTSNEVEYFEAPQLILIMEQLDQDVEDVKAGFERSIKYKKLDEAERKRKQNIRLLDVSMKRLFVNLAIVTSARRGEIAGLREADVELGKKRIVYKGTAYFETGEGIKFKGRLKNKNHKKIVYLPDYIIPMIQEHLTLLETVRWENPDWTQNDNLFVVTKVGKISKRGDPIGVDTYTTWFHKWCIRHKEELGLSDMEAEAAHLHMLRHSGISYELNNGVALNTVASIAGHSDVTVTSGIYGHIYTETKQEAAKNFDRLHEKMEATGKK